jgi:hypothetical protein
VDLDDIKVKLSEGEEHKNSRIDSNPLAKSEDLTDNQPASIGYSVEKKTDSTL